MITTSLRRWNRRFRSLAGSYFIILTYNPCCEERFPSSPHMGCFSVIRGNFNKCTVNISKVHCIAVQCREWRQHCASWPHFCRGFHVLLCFCVFLFCNQLRKLMLIGHPENCILFSAWIKDLMKKNQLNLRLSKFCYISGKLLKAISFLCDSF